MEPVGEVHFGDRIRERVATFPVQPADDVAVGKTILEHLVDAQAEGVWKAGNLAFARPVFPAQEGEEIPATSSGFVVSRPATA